MKVVLAVALLLVALAAAAIRVLSLNTSSATVDTAIDGTGHPRGVSCFQTAEIDVDDGFLVVAFPSPNNVDPDPVTFIYRPGIEQPHGSGLEVVRSDARWTGAHDVEFAATFANAGATPSTLHGTIHCPKRDRPSGV